MISLKRAQEVCVEEGSSRSCKRRRWRVSSEKEHLAILKKSSRRRNRRSGFVEENCEIPSAVRSRKSCTGFKPEGAEEATPGGIGNRRIGDPEGVSSTHFNPRSSETPIGGRTVVLWTSRSHAKELARGS
jgi:hypothetical protein